MPTDTLKGSKTIESELSKNRANAPGNMSNAMPEKRLLSSYISKIYCLFLELELMYQSNKNRMNE